MLNLSIREKAMADDGAAFAFTPAQGIAGQGLRDKVHGLVPVMEWCLAAPLIEAIAVLKREKNAVILAHNYMTPEIFHGVGDFVGDSLGLAREAARSDAAIIVQAGVHFMAETSKVLCPDKTVLIPDLAAGCSLAASITAADVRLIKQRYPGHAVQAGHIAAQCGASAYASKYIVVVDDDVDVTNLDHLLWAMLTRTDPKESIQFIEGSWDSPADPRLSPEKRAAAAKKSSGLG